MKVLNIDDGVRWYNVAVKFRTFDNEDGRVGGGGGGNGALLNDMRSKVR